ncbi:MAG: hypothetical protein HS124_01315 [Anaerolineales bacterium]|nr:hypothetical protein [Anaerolineales bacterium]MCL4260385.1 hypothetical protein [Anaerolineales bacterium]
MNNKNTGMIATIVTAILCGCCALFACIFGFGTITGNGTFTLGDTAQPMPPTYGYVFLCLSFLMILVPVIVGFVTLKKKPADAAAEVPPAPPSTPAE